jgi:hypothetical protein
MSLTSLRRIIKSKSWKKLLRMRISGMSREKLAKPSRLRTSWRLLSITGKSLSEISMI